MDKAKDGEVIYLIEKVNGDRFYLTVPEDWKLTYGPIWTPPENKRGFGGGSELRYCLRFYDKNKERTRAMFDDVKSFRDNSLPLTKEIITEKGTITYKIDEDSKEHNERVERSKVLQLER